MNINSIKFEEKREVWYFVDKDLVPWIDLKSVIMLLGYKSDEANKCIHRLEQEYDGIVKYTVKDSRRYNNGTHKSLNLQIKIVRFETLYEILFDHELVERQLYEKIINFVYVDLHYALQQAQTKKHIEMLSGIE